VFWDNLHSPSYWTCESHLSWDVFQLLEFTHQSLSRKYTGYYLTDTIIYCNIDIELLHTFTIFYHILPYGMILYILIRHVQVQRSLQKPTEAHGRFILRFCLQDESESFASTKTTEPTAYLDNKRNVCKEVEGSHGYPSLQSLITLGPLFFVGTCRWWVISNMCWWMGTGPSHSF